MSKFFDLGIWIWIAGNWILFKMSFGWVIYHKVWECYAWSNLSWLFLKNPNLATFGFWWIVSNPWWIMINPWSNDECNFKILLLTKNIEVRLYVDHNWLFTQHSCFQSSEPLTEQAYDVRLDTWHENYWRPMTNHENHLKYSLRNSKP